MEDRKETVSYLNNVSLFLLGILFLVFPVFTINQTTEPYILPKQAVLIGLSLLIVFLLGIRTLVEKKVVLRRTPFDLPLLLIAVVFLISSLLSVNRIDAITAFIPFLFAVIAYFLITNLSKDKSSLIFIKSCIVGGGAILAILATLNYFKIYLFPFDFAKNQAFTPLGTLLESTIYLFLTLLVSLEAGIKVLRKKKLRKENIAFLIIGIITLIGFIISFYQLVAQKPLILPFETGFQTAFLAISQDSGRVIQSFLFGSGFGTFAADFTRFKPASFNLTPFWMFSFFRSSSFVLELLATVGILGVASFFLLIYRIVKEKPLFIPIVLAIVGLFLLPFSFLAQLLFFALLGVFAAATGLTHLNKYFDIELELVTLKKGLISFETPKEERRSDKGKAFAIVFFIISLVFVGLIGFYGFRFMVANVNFQKSLVAAAQNNGTQTYQSQVAGLRAFPQNDSYQRVFSQTNLALANNLADATQKSGQKPDVQTSQTIYTLIQQSINAARTATSISPLTALNWQNLSSIYRSLIGFGQNADQFAILSAQQAILLDPNNPQGYVNLGGIYYQLGIWDNAIAQFQVAVNLKPDYANAYYNLGHALEQKGDYKNALTQYQTVKSLVANDSTNLKKIEEEIKTLTAKTNLEAEKTETGQTATAEKQNIEVNTPPVQLPQQNPPVKIPAPQTEVTPTPKASE